jgi:predicted nucleic acid-binding Zn ribbon protein
MKCLECNKEINVNIYESMKFCSSKCCMKNYQKRERGSHRCLVCGKNCYSKRGLCFDCGKLNKNQLKQKQRVLNL